MVGLKCKNKNCAVDGSYYIRRMFIVGAPVLAEVTHILVSTSGNRNPFHVVFVTLYD